MASLIREKTATAAQPRSVETTDAATRRRVAFVKALCAILLLKAAAQISARCRLAVLFAVQALVSATLKRHAMEPQPAVPKIGCWTMAHRAAHLAQTLPAPRGDARRGPCSAQLLWACPIRARRLAMTTLASSTASALAPAAISAEERSRRFSTGRPAVTARGATEVRAAALVARTSRRGSIGTALSSSSSA